MTTAYIQEFHTLYKEAITVDLRTVTSVVETKRGCTVQLASRPDGVQISDSYATVVQLWRAAVEQQNGD